ncbi:hypothetical protein [Chryseobacterium sp. ISL-6]|uniref:hypothetical protein n=1 Tax=Chryseobacterium sp. ISL-6 TaxID=2819143 RepID=UPI001BE777CE|nr:hypothetical protein [Chryseobacterium sp. ISL-6]MBT2622433.1 hypothetical protein [Chryseobacterium sp. ISL-6]
MLEYKKIKIASNQSESNELISFLYDIIESNSKFEFYNFGIVRFYGITKDDSNEKLSKEINIFPNSDLFLQSINNIEQIFEIEILINDNIQSIKRYSNEEDSYKNNQICLEFFDDGFWEMTSKDYSLIDSVSKKYMGLEIL